MKRTFHNMSQEEFKRKVSNGETYYVWNLFFQEGTMIFQFPAPCTLIYKDNRYVTYIDEFNREKTIPLSLINVFETLNDAYIDMFEYAKKEKEKLINRQDYLKNELNTVESQKSQLNNLIDYLTV